jgi:hypothetical protein
MARDVPLNSGFMLTSIVGFMISVLFVMKIDTTWGFTFSLFFILMFIASIISMSRIDAEDKEALEGLAIHERKRKTAKNKQ